MMTILKRVLKVTNEDEQHFEKLKVVVDEIYKEIVYTHPETEIADLIMIGTMLQHIGIEQAQGGKSAQVFDKIMSDILPDILNKISVFNE